MNCSQGLEKRPILVWLNLFFSRIIAYIIGLHAPRPSRHTPHQLFIAKRFDMFSPLTGGCSEGLDVFGFFFKHDKRRMRAQEQCFVRSVMLDAHDFG